MHVIFKTTKTKSEAEVWLNGSKRKYWVKAVNKLMKKGFGSEGNPTSNANITTNAAMKLLGLASCQLWSEMILVCFSVKARVC